MADHNPVVIMSSTNVSTMIVAEVDPAPIVETTLLDPALIGGTPLVYVNRVFDPNAQAQGVGGFVTWESENEPDSSGASYPGPSTFAETSDFTVESIRGSRSSA